MSYQTTQESIRTAVELAKTNWTDYTLKVEYDNAEVVQATDANPYLKVDIVYLGGDQLDLGEAPLVQDAGFIVLAACIKVGAGTAKAVKLLDHVRGYLELKDNLGAVRTHAAKLQKAYERNGMYYIPMLVGFWTQRATA